MVGTVVLYWAILIVWTLSSRAYPPQNWDLPRVCLLILLILIGLYIGIPILMSYYQHGVYHSNWSTYECLSVVQ